MVLAVFAENTKNTKNVKKCVLRVNGHENTLKRVFYTPFLTHFFGHPFCLSKILRWISGNGVKKGVKKGSKKGQKHPFFDPFWPDFGPFLGSKTGRTWQFCVFCDTPKSALPDSRRFWQKHVAFSWFFENDLKFLYPVAVDFDKKCSKISKKSAKNRFFTPFFDLF